jgi:transcriptional regulator
MKVSRWKDIRTKGKSPARVAAIDEAVKHELRVMDLREIRELAGKTQTDVAEELEASQAEVSRLERRDDFKLSTLKRYVEALGGEVEVYAAFGDKRVRLRSAE